MTDTREYVVVARRYRPQSFADLVGQAQVSQALASAISTNRVGHAYLFTGARGVGKTSTARILAKALNCQTGPTPTPCGQCDICESIAAGDDVDVLEIDGASNRGIDEIRQLRSNVSIRPSRARFKIYIIDEVHMLTTPAFNALLKTLEEPPEHVKFIFCTTDPEKIPITVLSRCQRFDFPPVETDAILERLQVIAQAEGIAADPEALRLLARRAAGSMRDSQSLLEQLLSACGSQITVEDVHTMLGTAPTGRLTALTAKLAARDTPGALAEVDAAVSEGVDVGQLAEQLLGHFRDLLAAAVGCEAEFMLHTATSDHAALVESGRTFGVEKVLAILQILDQTITRMRQTTHARVLLEVALVRICLLDQLDDLAGLVAQLRQQNGSGTAPSRPAPSPPLRSSGPAGAEKKTEKVTRQPHVESPKLDISPDSVASIWQQAVALIEDMTADYARYGERVAIAAPNRLVVSFKASYTLQKESCERPERKARIERALQQVTGQAVRVDFELLPDERGATERPKPLPSLRQRMRERERHPLVKHAMELFEAEMTGLEDAHREATNS